MPWNLNWPDGTQAVKNNRPTGQQNTAYIQTELNKDHFWNIGVDEDGHHKWAQMVATNDTNKALPTNAVNATGMDLTYFTRYKTSAESTAQQDSQPFAVAQSSVIPFPQAVLQLLGIRAMAVFNHVAGNVAQSIVYQHNVSSVTRIADGTYGVVYTNSLPSDNYLVLGGGMKSTSNAVFEPLFFSVSSAATVAARKRTVDVLILTSSAGGTLINGIQTWLICFGG